MTLPARAGRLFIAVLVVTTLFPIVASLLPPDRVPSWLGIVDVAVAVVFAILAFAIESRYGRQVSVADKALAWRAIQLAATAILILLVVFFLRADALSWPVLLIGLGWRAWLAIWVLPAVIASLRGPPTG